MDISLFHKTKNLQTAIGSLEVAQQMKIRKMSDARDKEAYEGLMKAARITLEEHYTKVTGALRQEQEVFQVLVRAVSTYNECLKTAIESINKANPSKAIAATEEAKKRSANVISVARSLVEYAHQGAEAAK